MTSPIRTAEGELNRVAFLTGVLAIVLLIVWLAGWTGPDAGSQWAAAIWVLLGELPWALLWLAAAAGLGWPVMAWFSRGESSLTDGWIIQPAIGITVMLLLEAALGPLGALQIAGSAGAWGLTCAGIGLLLVQFWRRRIINRRVLAPPALIWCAAPAVATLLLAATSAPGWLWSSEFGGYDAMSYHLQLPREWLSLGRITPLEHNVYSFLPGYMEAAYYHLAVLRGDGITAAYAAQLLHALITILAAIACGRLIARLTTPVLGIAACALVLGTPWIIVVGSLAYNEMAVIFLFASALLVLIEDEARATKRGALIGLLAAAACGAKLTSAGFVVVPIGIVMLIHLRGSARWKAVAAAMSAGVVGLLPWLVRNWAACGNPVFPFATDLLGTAHWTTEQAAIWSAGHRSEMPLPSRFAALWNQWLRFGLGSAPDPTEPWKPQWSILPWLGILGAVIGLSAISLRRWSITMLAMLLAQIAFWIGWTHLQSRFLLPTVVPAAIGIGLGAQALLLRLHSKETNTGRVHTMSQAGLALLLIAWCTQPMLILRSERGEQPAVFIGEIDFLTGDALNPTQRAELGRTSFPAIAINHLLPGDACVLLVGDARPFYYRGDITYQTTWDRGPLSRAMDEAPNDPTRWITMLRQQGFTHILVDPSMLDRWHQAGWADPRLTTANVMGALNTHATVLTRYQSGTALYRLARD